MSKHLHQTSASSFVCGILLALNTAFVLLMPSPTSAGPMLADTEALALVRRRVEGDRLYPRMDCISAFLEEKDDQFGVVALREIHNHACGGDPDVAPIVDRYRIDRSTKRIEWYNVLEDEYQPYSEALKSRRR